MARRLDGDTRREQIAQAALDLTAEGLSAVTVERVAEKVGIVPSALYRHFRNKDEILTAVQELLRKRLLNNAAQALLRSTGPLDALGALIRAQMKFLDATPGVPRILFSGAINLDDSRKQGFISVQDDFLEAIQGIIVQGQACGEISSDLDSTDLTYFFLGQLFLPLFMRTLREEKFDFHNRINRNWAMFKSMVATSPATNVNFDSPDGG